MMLRWFAIFILAFAVAKWSGNVQAEDELDDEDRLLLRALEDVMEVDNNKRAMTCETECSGNQNYDQCMEECVENKLVKRMEQAAQKQEAANKKINGQQKKAWIRFRAPPIPPVPNPTRRWWRKK